MIYLIKNDSGEVVNRITATEEFMEANMSEVYGMAQMQAFKRLAKDDQIFVQMCAMVLMSTTKFGPAMSAMTKLYEFGFQRLKWSGLLDLLQNAIKCLLGGLSFDDALNSLITSAIQAMNTEMFGTNRLHLSSAYSSQKSNSNNC